MLFCGERHYQQKVTLYVSLDKYCKNLMSEFIQIQHSSRYDRDVLVIFFIVFKMAVMDELLKIEVRNNSHFTITHYLEMCR